ncbi:Major facilitator-type transporter psiT2 [Psilocybe cubensis]|uniref:Major facilitator-type transporter psiT2 n=2 Tax=Psilocybe cubensis TaxID=181762 RepID=A0ACB8H272_PSICU|nr:Major facilitator-type transporter psiT2 [Psilocybe cubensis]KAH9481792.1 Major facilitator-type transporter psiT2 [Psilocybe cubensis]
MSNQEIATTASNEETPLLRTGSASASSNNGRTPLPKLQIAIVLLLQICEPISSQSIYPYINALISELDITGGDERKVGYYAGLIVEWESLFFATEALTVLQWSRASDHIGRKPVLLIGMLGLTISMLSFGLSRTFWALVISRCLTGLLNGNIGVMKSVMGELTDSTNRAEGFALMPVVWGFGATMGPLLGGSLSHPHERFPNYFGASFWKEYPYFLPCLVASAYVLFASLIALIWFKETIPKRKNPQQALESCDGTKSASREDPVPLRELLVYPIILSVSNYVVLAFLNIAVCALLPLFLAMPLEIGGLNYDPPAIGYIIGSYGAGSAIFQAFFFARIVRYFGEKRIFVSAMSTFIPVFLLFPMINICALHFGQQSTAVWCLIAILLAMLAFMDMAYGTIFMYITTSSPNKRSLGATNGLSQTTVSIARAIGPALSTSLFSYSVEKRLLGGFGVYAIFSILSVFALYLATRLPNKTWDAIQSEPIDD